MTLQFTARLCRLANGHGLGLIAEVEMCRAIPTPIQIMTAISFIAPRRAFLFPIQVINF